MSKQQVQLKEKELSIEDLKHDDHIGFITKENGKGFLHNMSDGNYQLLDIGGLSQYGSGGITIKDAFDNAIRMCCSEYKPVCAYRFDTRKELYQWLAEGWGMRKVNIHQHTKYQLTEYQSSQLILQFMATSIETGLPLNMIRTDLIKPYKIIYFKNKKSHRFSIYDI